jgi:hypothetical protein
MHHLGEEGEESLGEESLGEESLREEELKIFAFGHNN